MISFKSNFVLCLIIFNQTFVKTTFDSTGQTVCYPDVECFSLVDGRMRHTKVLPESPEKINTRFYLYKNEMKKESKHEVVFKDNDTVSEILMKKPIVFVIHGFAMNSEDWRLAELKDALLTVAPSVVLVDWRRGAQPPDYAQGSANTELVGRLLALFIKFVQDQRGVQAEDVHLIGFSLGGQIAGFAAKWYQEKFGKTLGRITGLDIAGQYFEKYPGSHLEKTDADFVDVIHTSFADDPEPNMWMATGHCGFMAPVGDVDFYPSGGAHQPKCDGKVWDIYCNHMSSLDYFTASITEENKCSFASCKCASWQSFDDCKSCQQPSQTMGYFSKKEIGRGIFYREMKSLYPFC